MDNQEYSIQELSEQTGVPRRNIHFYIQQGILPPPQGAGLGARYDENHRLRLVLIPLLRRRGLRLDQIREQLQQMDLPSLQALSTQLNTPTPPEPETQLNSQAFTHYSLPGGLVLVVPATLTPREHQKVAQIIQEAKKIFSSMA
jgi:DNA-binding transcriptional MerR regulator